MAKKASKADPFAVWGNPPPGTLHGMTDKQIRQLKAYIEKVTGDSYRLAYDRGEDNGFVEAATKIALYTSVQLKQQMGRTHKRTHRTTKAD
jgi:hypothetical protein